MHLRSSGRRFRVLGFAAALVGALLANAPAAHAAPVFVDAELVPDSYANASGVDCTVDPSNTGVSEPAVPVVENGPVASASTSVSATFGKNGAPEDTGSASGSASATAKVTSSGGVLSTIDFSGTSTYTLSTSESTCYRSGSAEVDLDFRFTVSQPGFLTLTMKHRGTSYGQVYINQTGTGGTDSAYVYAEGSGVKDDTHKRFFLPAGTYDGYFEASSTRNSDSPGTESGTTTVHAEFDLAGAQTAAPEGKGGKYVKFPASRNCAAHTLTPTVTEKGKRAKKIQSVKFFVNDKLVKKVRNPSKGEAVAVPIADDVDADVLARVKLEKVKKGVPAKKFEVTSSYIACS